MMFFPPPSPCGYLPDRMWQLRYDVVARITPAEYMTKLQQGWRRFGDVLFRPECPSCQMCQSLRVPVRTFRPGRSQRRAWNMNRREVSVRIGTPTDDAAKEDLFERFHHHHHTTIGWPEQAGHGLERFTINPFATEEWCYYLGERLIAVGYVDALPAGLSAIYFYWDPEERHRSLGTFNVLSIVESARQRGLPHVYLGYYVAGCRSLDYKARFRPNEVLAPGGRWEPFNS